MPSTIDERTLFLAWQDEETRRWYTVGKLDHVEGRYRFRYTEGARQAQKAGFEGVISFPDIENTYKSGEIFPLFANQVLSKKRPEYAEFIEWIALPEEKADPMAILARTSEKVSNTLEIYPQPDREAGRYVLHFFVRGVRHQTRAARERIADLQEGEELKLVLDVQNDFDPDACLLRTNEKHAGDMHNLGYLPRYLASEFGEADRREMRGASFEVVRVNPSPTPVHFRLLCRVSVEESVMSPFSSEEHQPLSI